MSICDDSGTSTSPTEWWENVNLSDVAGCRATVESFINGTGAADDSQLLLALPLFILCSSDHACLATNINEKTNRVCEEATTHPNKAKALDRLKEWLKRLRAINTGLKRLPKSYQNDVPVDFADITATMRRAILKVKRSGGIILRKPRDEK